MGTLIPTPVTLEDLIDDSSDINAFNDGVKTQEVSPRTNGVQNVLVVVKDDPISDRLYSGTADANVLNSLSDSTQTFITDDLVEVGDTVVGLHGNQPSATITAIVSETVLTLDADVLPLGTENYKILKKSYWEQKFGFGEWKRSGIKYGENDIVSYTLPVLTTVLTVHSVVYPWLAADIANYPSK